MKKILCRALPVVLLALPFCGCEKKESGDSGGDGGKAAVEKKTAVKEDAAVELEISQFDKIKDMPGCKVFSLELKETERGSLDLGYGNCQWLYPHDEAQEQLESEPEYGSDNPVYYAANYGDSQIDRMYSFVLDESGGPGSGYDTVYYDVNNDNRLDAELERIDIVVGNPSHSDKVRIKLEVEVEGEKNPYYVSLGAFIYKDDRNFPVEKIHMNLRNSSYYKGMVDLGGKQYQAAVGDLDSNGMFDDYEERMFCGDRLFIDLDGDNNFGDDNNEGFPFSQYIKIVDNWYEVAIKPSGDMVAIMPHESKFGTIKGSKQYKTVRLFSDNLNQEAEFHSGMSQVLVGEYKVSYVSLKNTDDTGRVWIAAGNFHDDHPVMKVVEGEQVEMPKLLPLEVSLTVKEKKPGELEIAHQVKSALGGVFRCPRVDGGRPSGEFAVEDDAGTVVFEGKFDYG